MSRFTVKKVRDGDTDVFLLSGNVTTGAAAALTQGTAGAGSACAFDWDDVVLVNSDGIREWIGFLTAFGKGRRLSFRRLRPMLVATLNVLPIAAAQVRISSLYGTFSCPECRKEHDELLAVPADVDDGGLKRAVACPRCDREICELNLPEDEYFALLAVPAW